MNLVRATLDGLAKFLGAEPHQAEVVYSEKSARAAFSRRGLFKAAGAVAAGTLFADAIYASKGTEERIRILGSWMAGRFKGKAPSAVYVWFSPPPLLGRAIVTAIDPSRGVVTLDSGVVEYV